MCHGQTSRIIYIYPVLGKFINRTVKFTPCPNDDNCEIKLVHDQVFHLVLTSCLSLWVVKILNPVAQPQQTGHLLVLTDYELLYPSGEVSHFDPFPQSLSNFDGKIWEHTFLTFPCGSVWKLNILPIRSNFNRKMKFSAMGFRCFPQDVWRLQLWTWNSAWRGSHFSWNGTLGQAWMALRAVLEDSQID